MIKKYKKIILSSLILLFLILGINVLAQGGFQQELINNIASTTEIVGQGPGYNTNAQGEDFFGGILIKIFGYGISFLGVFFMLLIVYSGFQWMFSSGNEEKVTQAKTRITQAVTGLVIVLGAFIISYAIFSFLTTEYLETPSSGIQAPDGYQEQIACSNSNSDTPPECADRGTRIYCSSSGNCVECLDDARCAEAPFEPLGLTSCDPTWNVCTFDLDHTCAEITNAGLCISNESCNWALTPSNPTWETGVCVNSNEYNCTTGQCPQDRPYCINNNKPEGEYSCHECSPGIDASCGLLKNCTQPFLEGGEGINEDDYHLYICTIFGF